MCVKFYHKDKYHSAKIFKLKINSVKFTDIFSGFHLSP